jgi:hypothetical protein
MIVDAGIRVGIAQSPADGLGDRIYGAPDLSPFWRKPAVADGRPDLRPADTHVPEHIVGQ